MSWISKHAKIHILCRILSRCAYRVVHFIADSFIEPLKLVSQVQDKRPTFMCYVPGRNY